MRSDRGRSSDAISLTVVQKVHSAAASAKHVFAVSGGQDLTGWRAVSRQASSTQDTDNHQLAG
jgi:hypothetical protein